MGEPLMDQYEAVSAYGVHTFLVRVTLGAASAFSYRSRDAVPTRPSTTTLKIALPKNYAEIVDFHVGRKAAVGVAGLEWIVTTDNVAVDGTVTLTSINSAGAATAPANGDVAFIRLGVSCDVLNDRFTGSG